jgi:hypothetical protein
MSTQHQTRYSARNAAAKVANEASMPTATTNEPTPATTTDEPTPATTTVELTPATHGRGSRRGKARGAKAGAEPQIAVPGCMRKRALSPEAAVTEAVPKGPEHLLIPKQKRSKVSSLG